MTFKHRSDDDDSVSPSRHSKLSKADQSSMPSRPPRATPRPQAKLPNIPSLPPISFNNISSGIFSKQQHSPLDRSAASADSFRTALSSIQTVTPSLNKSTSVDSFHPQGSSSSPLTPPLSASRRYNPLLPTTTPGAWENGPGFQEGSGLLSPGSSGVHDGSDVDTEWDTDGGFFIPPSKRRGASGSRSAPGRRMLDPDMEDAKAVREDEAMTIGQEDGDPSLAHESGVHDSSLDHDIPMRWRSNDDATDSDEGRHLRPNSDTGVSGKGKSRAVPRPGELLLPSRRTAISTTSTASSSASSLAGGSAPRRPSDVPPVPRLATDVGATPGTTSFTTGAFGHSSSTLPSTNNSISAVSDSEAEYVIAVVGSSGCGKTSLIWKGMKPYDVSEEATIQVGNATIKMRVAQINSRSPSNRPIHILEVDSRILLSTAIVPSVDGSFAWPSSFPRVDAILICYDVSQPSSFDGVMALLAEYHTLRLPVVLVACKIDLDLKLSLEEAGERAANYQSGLVPVTLATNDGKDRMRNCFTWLLKAIGRARRLQQQGVGGDYLNPASPDLVFSSLPPPWDTTSVPNSNSNDRTPEPQSPRTQLPPPNPSFLQQPPPMLPALQKLNKRSPSAPTSPVRARSTPDLLSRAQLSRNAEFDGMSGIEGGRHNSTALRDSANDTGGGDVGGGGDSAAHPGNGSGGSAGEGESGDGGAGGKGNPSVSASVSVLPTPSSRQPPPMQWATVDQILDKLLFLAVSDDDPVFIEYFFLVYRGFTSPRRVLLGMQKRMIELNREAKDPLLAKFAQMRICALLEEWIRQYPEDFAAPGASGALSALLRQIISNVHTTHYGSDLLPFLEKLPELKDRDEGWAVGSKQQTDGDAANDDPDVELDLDLPPAVEIALTPINVHPDDPMQPANSTSRFGTTAGTRTRTTSGSLLDSVSGRHRDKQTQPRLTGPDAPKGAVPNLKELQRVANIMINLDSKPLAEEITRMQLPVLLQIQPRDWLRHGLGKRPADGEPDPFSELAKFFNYLSNWVTSLCLAPDRVRLRAKVMEKFAFLARALRELNNYSGLRAVVSGMNNARHEDDAVSELVTSRPIWKTFRSLEVILGSSKMYSSYRLALRHTTGPAVPDMEIHTSDLARANSTNLNTKPDNPSIIHWGKFSLVARMICNVTTYTRRFKTADNYNFIERPEIAELLMGVVVMDDNMIFARQTPLGLSPSTPLGMQEPADHRDHAESPNNANRLLRFKIFSRGS